MTLKERLELIYHYTLQIEAGIQRLSQLLITDIDERPKLLSELQDLCARVREISSKGLD